jgi:pimeloyl-ACP methyl ester carboxylesterase
MFAVLAAALLASTSTLSPCVLAHNSGARVAAECGSVTTSATTKAGAPITVGFAVLRATGSSPSTTPLVLLAGGPGQAATSDFLPLLPVLEQLRADRDLILVDVRGTGRSTPVNCVDSRTVNERLASDSATDEARIAVCMRELPIAPALLTTADNVDDLERVRASLGVERWHILGVSYGTRLAFAYDAAHHDRTASLILDGVVAPDLPLGPAIAADMETSLRALGSNVVDDYTALRATLQAAPAPVRVRHPRTAAFVDVVVTSDMATNAVRMLLYADETRAVLGHLLHQARNGDLQPLAAITVMTAASVDGAIHVPVNLATLCAEDVPFIVDAPAPADALFPSSVTDMRHSCATFIVARRAAPKAAPTATPTLLLSGERDPITPPRHVERVLPLFSQGRHIVVPGMAHNVLPRGCIPTVVADALTAVDEHAPLSSVDVACVARIAAFPAFIDFQGPTP